MDRIGSKLEESQRQTSFNQKPDFSVVEFKDPKAGKN